MDGSAVTCWYSIFLDAYKYSSNYLILSLSVMITSLVVMWIYEKPQFYKLLFKRSKHSNVLSPVQSVECLEENSIQSMMEDMFEEKKTRELPKDDSEFY